jgi:hypothetical protein
MAATMCRKIFWPGVKTDANMAKNVTARPISRGENAIDGPGATGEFLNPDANVVTTAVITPTPPLIKPRRFSKRNTANVPASTASAPIAITSLRTMNAILRIISENDGLTSLPKLLRFRHPGHARNVSPYTPGNWRNYIGRRGSGKGLRQSATESPSSAEDDNIARSRCLNPAGSNGGIGQISMLQRPKRWSSSASDTYGSVVDTLRRMPESPPKCWSYGRLVCRGFRIWDT